METDLSTVSRIMLSMQRKLRELEFLPVSNERISKILPQSILIQKVSQQPRREGEAGISQESCPGILITPPNKIVRPGNAGENQTDECHYHILLQFIDVNREDVGGLHTYPAWQQKAARLFSRTDLDLEVFDTDAYVYFGHAEETTAIDEAMFSKHQNAKCFVIVHFVSNEPNT